MGRKDPGRQDPAVGGVKGKIAVQVEDIAVSG
jgi:hypothetical protein